MDEHIFKIWDKTNREWWGKTTRSHRTHWSSEGVAKRALSNHECFNGTYGRRTVDEFEVVKFKLVRVDEKV